MDKPYTFSDMIAEWRYLPGSQESIGLGDILTPQAPYVLVFPLDVEAWNERETLALLRRMMDPHLTLPAGAGDNPGKLSFDIQLQYVFTGRIDWHPCSNWNIVFSLWLETELEEVLQLLPETSWRTGRVIG
jgi:hypothetical protein